MCIRDRCERVTSYGSPASILVKKQEDLNMLHELGLEMIYLGLESGSDELLRRVNKGETADEIVRAGLMVKQAGMKPVSYTHLSIIQPFDRA